MKVKPLGDRIVIRREEAEDKTAGGILLPDNAKNKPQRGTVLAIGAGKMVKDGDKVLFTAWAGDEYKDRDTHNIIIMREEDILAVLD
jgi:chaperonin GroES